MFDFWFVENWFKWEEGKCWCWGRTLSYEEGWYDMYNDETLDLC